ncbi:MAG: sulfite exporter TauE/SafE family protein [Pseudomonadota bacterium]|nr:sulfite exporter TauE/SafE family protein [Pseudomonadota bacterium]
MVQSFIDAHGLLLAAAIAAGLASGFVGGLFGIGGGIVTVPALYALFRAYGIPEEPSLKTAIGTSLAVIIVTSIRSLMTHHAGGHVDARLLRAWAPWIAVGSGLGGVLARWVPGEALTFVFAAGALFIAWRRLAGGKGARAKPAVDLSSRAVHIPIGFGAGLFSSLMGLGGGAVGVMVMTWSGRSIHQAVATASGFGVAVAVPGALGFMFSGWAHEGLPPGSLGFVSLPAFVAVAAAAALTAPVGARLAHRLKGELLSKLFALYIGATALALFADMFS